MVKAKAKKKPAKKPTRIASSRSPKWLRKLSKLHVLFFVLIIAGIGTYFIFRSQAATNSYLLPPAGTCPNSATYSLPQESMWRSMACQTNHVRKKAAKPTLSYQAALNAAAVDKGYNILKCNHFEHSGWNRNRTCYVHTMNYFLNKHRVMHICRLRGENLAWGQYQKGYVPHTVNNWLQSPTHRAVLLNGSYRYGGTGVARGVLQGKPYTSIWVHYYCAR